MPEVPPFYLPYPYFDITKLCAKASVACGLGAERGELCAYPIDKLLHVCRGAVFYSVSWMNCVWPGLKLGLGPHTSY